MNYKCRAHSKLLVTKVQMEKSLFLGESGDKRLDRNDLGASGQRDEGKTQTGPDAGDAYARGRLQVSSGANRMNHSPGGEAWPCAPCFTHSVAHLR